mmetsp:Transcript_12678/g.19525  ORF Transcript_12678/g.19525 Transcript_12678/m.19525 type:complete len:697 (-) Transcript_12678:108-2198(-)
MADDEEAVELVRSGEDAAADNNKGTSTLYERLDQWRTHRYILPRHYKLQTEEDTRKYSLWSVNFMITCSAINTKMLNPNFAIMCNPYSGDEESFPNTSPFGFNSATYFLPMCTLIGVAIASIFIGTLSDRLGRKILMLVLGWISAVGSIVKYFTRHTFWGFCISNFIFGFFLGNLPIGMAYIGDIEQSKKKKELLLGMLVGCFVLGNSGGGIVAVLMADVGLFAPLWVGAGLMVIANILSHQYMIEPTKGKTKSVDIEDKFTLNEDDEDVVRPELIDQKTLWNIVGGALLDNIGSTGLFPLCLSPLALQAYYAQFVAAGEDPIMSILAYQWLSVCVALLVIPSTQMTPWFFEKLGVAGVCVFGNSCTAIVTGLLLMIGAAFPATNLSFGFFVFVMYAGFPFTVFSQLTTGPMLDAIAPEDKIGFVQGLNNASMNFGMALAPWLFGLLADATSTQAAIITGICFSIGAALANAPLMRHPLMGKQVPRPPPQKRILKGEDEEIVQKMLSGSYVDPELRLEVAKHRAKNGLPTVVPRVRPYAEEKENLGELAKEASATFEFRRDLADRILAALSNGEGTENDFSKEEFVNFLNTVSRGDSGNQDQELIQQATSDLGVWMGEYLEDNGYSPHTASVLMKQMFMTAFPRLNDGPEIDEENVEEYLLRQRRVMNSYAEHKKKTTLLGTFARSAGGYHGHGWW